MRDQDGGGLLSDWLAPALKSMHGPIDAWLLSLPPWVWTASAIALIVLGAFSTLLFSREYVFRGAPDRAAWRDLRIWALLFVIPFVLVYLLF